MELAIALATTVAVNAFVLAILQKRYDPELFRVVALTYVTTLGLRIILGIFLWLNYQDPGFAQMFWGDSGAYDSMGASLAAGWAQGANPELWKATVEGTVNKGFIYFIAVIYYIFGHNTLLAQLLNATVGTIVPIVILEIGLFLYNRRVATLAMMFTALFPQMIFWSAGLYKDAAVMFCIAVSMLATLRLRASFSARYLVVYFLSAGALVWLRFYIFYALVASTLVGFVWNRQRNLLAGLLLQVSVVASVIGLLLLTPAGQEMVANNQFLNLQQLQISRSDLAERGASGYGLDADVSNPYSLLAILPLGVAYLLFSPFPWQLSGLRQMLALPDVLAWYALVPALIRGLLYVTRHRLSATMPMLVFTTALTLAYGAFLGNVGTAYRQRTQIMMFYFLFIAQGIHSGREQRARNTIRPDGADSQEEPRDDRLAVQGHPS